MPATVIDLLLEHTDMTKYLPKKEHLMVGVNTEIQPEDKFIYEKVRASA